MAIKTEGETVRKHTAEYNVGQKWAGQASYTGEVARTAVVME